MPATSSSPPWQGGSSKSSVFPFAHTPTIRVEFLVSLVITCMHKSVIIAGFAVFVLAIANEKLPSFVAQAHIWLLTQYRYKSI